MLTEEQHPCLPDDIDIAKAVAERCGFTNRQVRLMSYDLVQVERPDLDGIIWWEPFDPANDERDAFRAADAVGLFKDFQGDLEFDGEWMLAFRSDGEWLFGRGPTPARAIIAAILALPKGERR